MGCQFGQLVGVDPVTLVAIFRDPGMVLRMRADYALDQWGDDRRGPWCQLARFQMHVNLAMQSRKGVAQVRFAGWETAVHHHGALVVEGSLLKRTRPQIQSDVNFVHADVSFSLNNQVLEKAGSLSRWRHLLLETYLKARTFIVPLDASGGRVFLN